MSNIKHLGISGGGTKIHGLFGAARVVMEKYGYYPDLYTGISAGSILAIPLALGLYDEVHAITSILTLDDFFSKKPVNKKNKISFMASLRAALGVLGIIKCNSLGDMGNLYGLLRNVVTPARFAEYKNSKKTYQAFVGYIEAKTGARKYINLKECNYEEAILAIVASSSIPVFTKPVHIGNDIAFDGGVRDHVGTGWILEEMKIDQTLTIYSRPQDLTNFLNANWQDKNLFDVLMRVMEIQVMEISKSDEMIETEMCKNKNILQKKIFLPRMMDGFYDVAPSKMKALHEAGKKNADEEMMKPW